MFRASRNVSRYDFFMSDEEIQARKNEVHELERAALEPSTRSALESHKRCYIVFCRSAKQQAFPVSFDALSMYLSHYCKWLGNTARSIATILSHLKRANRAYSKEWLDPESQRRLNDVITTLKKRDSNESKQKLPITHKVMSDIEAAADLSRLDDFQHIVMSRVARDVLLRGVELVALNIGGITWNTSRSQVTVSLSYSKAHKRVDVPERVIITDYGPSSAVAYLREYFRVMGLDKKPPTYPLWPQTDAFGGIKWKSRVTKDQFIGHARRLLKRAGYDYRKYAGHSYRSGGTTDLWESGRCRPLTIKLQGRWKSDAYRLYIRDNPHKTAQEVAHAMAFFDEVTDDGELVVPPHASA